jgi:phosphohistidine phosphatase
MRIYLMRHGVAVDREDPECPPDPERYLTPDGVERTRAAAEGLLELKVKPDALLTSPYVRAVQTGEIVCETLDLDPKNLHATDALKSEAKPERLADELSKIKAGEIICFGHAPQLDEFIAYALRAHTPFTSLRKAGVACLDMESFSAPRAVLVWLLTAKALRKLGK